MTALNIVILLTFSALGQQALPSQLLFDSSSIKGTSGYFRVARTIAGQWWFLTPLNQPFFYKGICAINRAGKAGGRNAMPGKYAITIDKKYNYQDNPDSFVAASLEKLRFLGFNALGAWTTEEFFNRNMPFTEILEFFKEPPFLPTSESNELPDIFDPLWQIAIDKKARALCSPLRLSKDLVGYYTDNEIGFGNADDSGLDPGFKAGKLNFALLRTLLAMDTNKAASKFALHFLLNRYSSFEKLSEAWQVNVKSMTDLQTLTASASSLKSAGYQQDATAFVQQYAQRYFELAYKAIKRHDPNHLILGCRFGTVPPAYILDAIRPWTDVISANNYRPTLYERYDTLFRYTKLPLLIGEISWNTSLFKMIPFAGERTTPLSDAERMFKTGKKTLMRAAMHDGIIGFTWYRWVQETSSSKKFYDGIVDYNDEFDMHASVLKSFVAGLDSVRVEAATNNWKYKEMRNGELIVFPEAIKPGWDQYIRIETKNGHFLKEIFGWQLKGEVFKTKEKGNTLAIHIRVNFDPVSSSSSGEYELNLHRNGEKFYGTYTGNYQGKRISGKVKAFYFPD